MGMAARIRKDRKYVLLMRHLPQEEASFSTSFDWRAEALLNYCEALALAVRIHHNLMRWVPLAYAGVSELVRTFQTLALVAPGVQRIEWPSGLTPIDHDNCFGTWDFLRSLKRDATIEEVASADPKLFARCAAGMVAAVEETLKEIETGQVALLITHSPLIEAGLSSLLGGLNKLPAPMIEKGDVVWLEFEGSNTRPDFHQLLRY